MVCGFFSPIQKIISLQLNSFSLQGGCRDRFFFRNIYLDSIWTGQTRASVFLRLQRDSTVDHPSLLSGHVSVKSCQKVLHRTRPFCSECIVDVFAVCCGCFVLVSVVNTCWIQIHRGEICIRESPLIAIGARRSSVCNICDQNNMPHLSAKVVITLTNLWTSFQIVSRQETICG